MKQFGKYAILKAVTYKFENEPEWFWKINPPTVSAEMEVAKLLSTDRERTDRSGMKTSQAMTTLELALREIAVTFGGTNVKDDDGVLLVSENASIEEVEAALTLLPREMILEIWEAVGDACPGWGPVTKRRKSPTTETPETKI